MAKITKETQNNKDEMKILAELQKNSKESVDSIAKRCGFSRQKACRIIKQLENNHEIWGYTAIGTEKDLQHFVLLVKRSIVPFDESLRKEIMFEKLDDHLPSGVKIENIFSIHGRYDALVTFFAPDLKIATKVPEAIFQRLSKYVDEYLLMQTLIPIRKQGFKNPQIKSLVNLI